MRLREHASMSPPKHCVSCGRTIEPRRPMRVQRALIDRQSIVWPPTRSMLLTTSLSPIGSGASAPYRCKPLARCPGCQRRGRGALQRRSPYRRTLRVRPPGLDRLRIRIRIRGVLGVLVDRGLNIAAGIRAATRGHPRRDERSAVRRTLGVLSPMTRLGLYSASRRNDDAPAVLRAPRPRARRSRRRWASWRLLRRAPLRDRAGGTGLPRAALSRGLPRLPRWSILPGRGATRARRRPDRPGSGSGAAPHVEPAGPRCLASPAPRDRHSRSSPGPPDRSSASWPSGKTRPPPARIRRPRRPARHERNPRC